MVLFMRLKPGTKHGLEQVSEGMFLFKIQFIHCLFQAVASSYPELVMF